MSKAQPDPLVVNGWTIFAHPLFLDQLEELTRQVQLLSRKDPVGFVKKNATKRLAAIAKLAFEIIPQDPSRTEYRQGNTLGEDRKHWFRAKFFQQYRLFFRYHAQSKVIVFAWVTPSMSKRTETSNGQNHPWPANQILQRWTRQPRCLHISAHRGRRFRLMVDAISA